jgi:hypothetical protein
MDKGKGLLPNRTDGQNSIVEKVITWKPIVTDKDSDVPTSEENTSEEGTSEQVHLSHAGEVDVWERLGVEVKKVTRSSAT